MGHGISHQKQRALGRFWTYLDDEIAHSVASPNKPAALEQWCNASTNEILYGGFRLHPFGLRTWKPHKFLGEGN
jgi:hypothetical protein